MSKSKSTWYIFFMNGFCPLASGSKGNCLYFSSGKTKVLIDAGISTRMLEQRLSQIGVGLGEIDAIFITHEHTDHIQGLKVLLKRYPIPLIANADTVKGIYESLRFLPKCKIFTTGEPFEYQDLYVHPFSIQHDTVDPVGFSIFTNKVKVGICTDLGFVTTGVKNQLQKCDYLYVEANHEPHMVEACARPSLYKQRVLGRQGHLSNEECAYLLTEVLHGNLKHVHLAHLSSECNTKELAWAKVRKVLPEEVGLAIAYQEKISEPVHFTKGL